MRCFARVFGALALVIVLGWAFPATAKAQTPGALAVLRGAAPYASVDLRSVTNGVTLATWFVGGASQPKGLALRYDDGGALESVFVAFAGDANNPASIRRIVAATGAIDSIEPTYSGSTLYDLVVDLDGSLLLAMRTPTDGGCVYRLSAFMSTTTLVACLPWDRTPWALARMTDGRVLIGWNKVTSDALSNTSNGLTLLDPATGTMEDVNSVSPGTGAPVLSSIAVAPGDRIYFAEYVGTTAATISWLTLAQPGDRHLLFPQWSTNSRMIVKPGQMTVAGQAGAHSIYVADSWGPCGGMFGMPGQPCPGGGALVTIVVSDVTVGQSSRVPIPGGGPYGAGAVQPITATPEDAGTGTSPVSVTFDAAYGAGTTSLTISSDGALPPSGFKLGDPGAYYHISTTASFYPISMPSSLAKTVTVCVNYSGITYTNEAQLTIRHWNGTEWEPLAYQTLDTVANIVCGRTASFSPFAIFEPIASPRDTTPPALTLPASMTLEATSALGATAAFTATAIDETSGAVPVVCNPASGSTFPLGVTTVACRASDAAGNVAYGAFTITVRDATPPSIDLAVPSATVLWPPNHQMVPVRITVSATDRVTSSPSCSISDVSSSEPVSGLGDGDTSPDWLTPVGLTVNLRAERAGTGSGRTYSLTVRCVDGAGNAALRTVSIGVPKSQSGK